MLKRFIFFISIILLMVTCMNDVEDKVQINKTLTIEELTEKEVSGHYINTYSKQALEEDFDTFVETLMVHNTFTFSDKEKFVDLSIKLKEDLYEGMNELEFYRLLSKMIAFINCSHSRVTLSDNSRYIFYANNYFMPIDVVWLDNRLYLINSSDDIEIPLGSEILSINSVASGAIVDEIFTMLSSDGNNISYKTKQVNDRFYYLYNLFYDNRGYYNIEYLDIDTGEIKSISFVGVSKSEADLINKPFDYGKRLDYDIYETYAYLRVPDFNTRASMKIRDYESYFEDFFKKLKDAKTPNLIIDIRDNNGGHPIPSNSLLSYLAKEDFTYFDKDLPGMYPSLQDVTQVRDNAYKGVVYVLCDGGSLSTSGHFLALFSYHQMGYIVGEISGAGSICTDSSFDTLLVNTKITLRLSSVKWYVNVDQVHYGGIVPDFPYSPSLEDVINGQDATLEYLIDMINK